AELEIDEDGHPAHSWKRSWSTQGASRCAAAQAVRSYDEFVAAARAGEQRLDALETDQAHRSSGDRNAFAVERREPGTPHVRVQAGCGPPEPSTAHPPVEHHTEQSRVGGTQRLRRGGQIVSPGRARAGDDERPGRLPRDYRRLGGREQGGRVEDDDVEA